MGDRENRVVSVGVGLVDGQTHSKAAGVRGEQEDGSASTPPPGLGPAPHDGVLCHQPWPGLRERGCSVRFRP